MILAGDRLRRAAAVILLDLPKDRIPPELEHLRQELERLLPEIRHRAGLEHLVRTGLADQELVAWLESLPATPPKPPAKLYSRDEEAEKRANRRLGAAAASRRRAENDMINAPWVRSLGRLF